ncbi:hypothetical protein M378DRAFT_972858 [Amanita muscaria Koide BX008]|uniref:Ssl1-like domain-containing protein n=1 Tax=Amanita muscaria (strain Koide BX008) TaxID=946122 RepID=A0A0C2SW79_AMAMK|nr:hypothetical protein M378DRAFT_972858 [Amanita muscaria Koide BX008]
MGSVNARSWDMVQEDEAGSLQTSVEELLARGRRKRLLAPAAAVRRTIIRHLILLLNLSASMMDRDMRLTRFDLMLQYAREFITEWFDQNSLGQMGIVGMRSGLGEKIGRCECQASPSYSSYKCIGNSTHSRQETLKMFSAQSQSDISSNRRRALGLLRACELLEPVWCRGC